MRKIIYCSSIFCLGLFLLLGCENHLLDESVEMIPEQYSEIGRKHNEGLEYFYQELKSLHIAGLKNGTKLTLSTEDYRALMISSVGDFMEKNGYPTLIETLENTFFSLEKPLLKSENSEDLDPIFLELKKELDDLINSEIAIKNLRKFKSGLDKINKKAERMLSETDAIVIYAGTSTAFNSFLYWRENYPKWAIVLNYPELLDKYTDEELNNTKLTKAGLVSNPDEVQLKSWWDKAWSAVGEAYNSVSDTMIDWWNNGGGKEIVSADAGGAVSGAMAGAMGALASGGTLAAPAMVAGGIANGVYNSIDASIQNLMK